MTDLRRTTTPSAWATRLSDVWDVGIVVLGSDGQLDFANARARALLAARPDDVLEARWPEFSGTLAQWLTQAVPGRAAPIEATLVVAEGVAGTLRVQIYVVEEDDCTGHLLILQHAGRAMVIESALRHATQNRGLASLYRDMAHDLKSVLNVIGMNLALLSHVAGQGTSDASDLDLAERCHEVMRRELHRLDRSIDLILDRNMVERPEPERFDIRMRCESVARLVAARAERQRVAVELDLGDEPAEILGHPDRLQGALLNLAVNALDAMPEGGALSFRVGRAEGVVRVEVADSGPGIAEEVLPDLWRQHVTTKPGGTGLGLHVTRAAVESHGGRIAYHRREHGGASFTLDFPEARGF
ncbi:MAG: HAMP domain-containing histidine kinase [Acidobacteria bacterium]|nr:HAMP domain-containing histidine kinase [Acidobacteriota bacterium]